MKKILTGIMAIGLMVGASASDIKEHFEIEYMTGCVDVGENYTLAQSTAYCMCQWQGVEDRYTDDELSKINNANKGSETLNEFLDYLNNRGDFCLSKAGEY